MIRARRFPYQKKPTPKKTKTDGKKDVKEEEGSEGDDDGKKKNAGTGEAKKKILDRIVGIIINALCFVCTCFNL